MANKVEFNKEQIGEIYQLIAGVNSDFINQLAQAAIESMLEVQQNMFNDREANSVDSNVAPDDNDIRAAAVDFTMDTMAEFNQLLKTRIEEISFKGNIKIQHQPTLEFDLKFD